ncbi:ABC transporter permease [Streptomyces rubiginosohelvolus]|uniref:ABC transporter permease n=1 Tax=Streptomyces rubiginosohelvolus TaxID=67362 RepID=UPI0037B73CF5
MLLPVSVTLGVVLAVLLVFAAAVAAWASLGRSREILVAGVRAAAQLAARRGEVEAGMTPGRVRRTRAGQALGLPERDARVEIVRPAASDALLPGLDQTRTVGLVTLPGAFVGMLLGGALPVEAGAVQLFVLVALTAVQVAAVATVLELVVRGLLYRD